MMIDRRLQGTSALSFEICSHILNRLAKYRLKKLVGTAVDFAENENPVFYSFCVGAHHLAAKMTTFEILAACILLRNSMLRSKVPEAYISSPSLYLEYDSRRVESFLDEYAEMVIFNLAIDQSEPALARAASDIPGVSDASNTASVPGSVS